MLGPSILMPILEREKQGATWALEYERRFVTPSGRVSRSFRVLEVKIESALTPQLNLYLTLAMTLSYTPDNTQLISLVADARLTNYFACE